MKTIQLDYNDLFIASLFTIVGDSVVIRSSGGDVLYTLPTGLGITTEESDGSTLTFTSGNYYFVISGFPSTVQRDADNAVLVAACNTGGGGGGGGGGGTPLSYTTSTLTATTTPQTLLAANPNRKYYSVQATAGGVVMIGEGTTPSATIANKRLLANGFYETANVVPTNQIEVRTVTGTNILTITEAQ